MQMDRFKKYLTENFSEFPGVGYRLRDTYSTRWVRFHSLPESERYADNEAEYAIILERANLLASRILGEDTECWLVTSISEANENNCELKEWIKIRDKHKLKRSFSWKDPLEEPDDQIPWVVYAAETVWSPRKFDDEILFTADDGYPKLFWVSKYTNGIFYPYDGGFDLILPNPQDVIFLKSEFSDWLSPHAHGM